MTRVEMKRNFKEKAGYTLIVMQEKPYECYKYCIKFKNHFVILLIRKANL